MPSRTLSLPSVSPASGEGLFPFVPNEMGVVNAHPGLAFVLECVHERITQLPAGDDITTCPLPGFQRKER